MAQTLSLSPTDNIRNQLQLLTSGVNPIQPPEYQLPYVAPANSFESVLGTDLDASSISPREMANWYSDRSFGYGEDAHQQYIKNAESVMDMPLIPARAAASAGAFGYPPDSPDLTIRQLIDHSPLLAEIQANVAYMNDPESPEKKAAYEQIAALNAYHDQNPDQPHPLKAEVYNALTGQRTNSPHAMVVAGQVLDALKAGVRGGKFESDPSIPADELEKLQSQYGEEANRMLPKGGVDNARREMAYDLLAAIHSGQNRNPIFDNPSTLWSAFEPDSRQPDYGPSFGGFPQGMRSNAMWDKSAMRGRMTLANDRFSRANQSFEQGGEKPYVVNADNFNRLDPGSYQGLMGLSENASWPYARGVYHPIQPVMGDMLARNALAENAIDADPYRFQVQMLNMNQREAPVRFPEQSPQESRQVRDFVKDRLAANADYLPTHMRPMLADMANDFGAWTQKIAPRRDFQTISRKPYNFEATGYAMPYAVATSPPQLAMVGSAAAKMGALPFAGMMAKEAFVDEPMEDAAINPANANFVDKRVGSAWMRPYTPGQIVPGTGQRRTEEEFARMLDPDNREEWDRGVQETNAKRLDALQKQYDRWKQLRPQPQNEEPFTIN